MNSEGKTYMSQSTAFSHIFTIAAKITFCFRIMYTISRGYQEDQAANPFQNASLQERITPKIQRARGIKGNIQKHQLS